MNDTSAPTGSLEPTPIDEFVEAIGAMVDRVTALYRLEADIDHKLTVVNAKANALAHAVKACAATAELPAHLRDLIAQFDQANDALLAAYERRDQAVAS